MASQSYIEVNRQLAELWVNISNSEISDNDSEHQLALLMNRLQEMVQLGRLERMTAIEERERRAHENSVRYLRPVLQNQPGPVYVEPVQPPPVRRRPVARRRVITPIENPEPEPTTGRQRRQAPTRRRGRRPILIIDDDDSPSNTVNMNVLPYRIKIKTVSKEINDQPCSDTCPICMDTHTKSECIKTECEHEFGKKCFESWMTARNSNKKCPSCRMECSVVTMYKSKKEKQVVEENNVIVIV
jgi:hypothetical protein